MSLLSGVAVCCAGVHTLVWIFPQAMSLLSGVAVCCVGVHTLVWIFTQAMSLLSGVASVVQVYTHLCGYFPRL